MSQAGKTQGLAWAFLATGLASAALAGWLSYSAQPNQVMSVMMVAIAVLASVFALIGVLAKSSNNTKIILAFSGILLAVGTGAGLLLGALGPGHLPTLFVAEWVIIAMLMALLSRTVGLVLAGLALLPLGWVLWRGHDTSTVDLVLYLSLTLVPLSVGLLLPRYRSSSAVPSATPASMPATTKPPKSSNSSTHVIVNAMSEGVITLNRDGVITLVNPAAEKISGWSRQDALGLNYKSVLNLVDKTFKQIPDADNPISLAIGSNAPTDSRRLLLETKSEKRINLSIIVTPIDDINGGIIVVFRDITSELAEESAQTEFISTASHEMRTPVASIEGYLGLALNPNTSQIDDRAREYITKAHESAEHLGQLFQDLLDITKADDGLLQSSPEPINLASFAGDVIDGLRHKATEKSLNLEFAPRNHSLATGAKATKSGRRVDPSYYVRVDKNHLREIIANLTENAIKYTLAGGIKVDITGDNQHVVLSFADTGIGIPTEDAEHLFQKFYRVDNSDTREIGGTGLGLYLVRKLVDTMGGRIWVESEYGKGSTFFVQLDRLDSITAKQQIAALAINKTRESPAPASNPAPAAPVDAPSAPAPEPPTAPAAQPATQPQPALQQQQAAPAPAPAATPQPTATPPSPQPVQPPAQAPATNQPPMPVPGTQPPTQAPVKSPTIQPPNAPATSRQPAAVVPPQIANPAPQVAAQPTQAAPVTAAQPAASPAQSQAPAVATNQPSPAPAPAQPRQSGAVAYSPPTQPAVGPNPAADPVQVNTPNQTGQAG